MEKKMPTQRAVKLEDLIKMNLTIPPYQRPYKWTEKNVVTLLDDIFEYVILKNKDYRIGNVILHEESSNVNNVVDGQQRLTTISILLKQLEPNFDKLLLHQNFKHKISKNNIVYNFRIINQWISTKFGEDERRIKEFYNQILKKCEFILFFVYGQEEAFQLFDSQNSRGKELEPYDLLKAFHLREMDHESEEEKAKYVERWEKSIDDKTLKPILGNHLFRIRKWSKNEWKYNFTKDEIDEFKGISLHQSQEFPYESAMRMLDGFVANAQHDKFLRNMNIAQEFPFSITMPIINGKRFFEYVDFYILQREKLFDLNKEDSIRAEIPEFVEFYEEYCKYKKHWRSGDEKVRNLYENILLAFIDKFGYIEDLKNYYQAFYKAVYIIRCENKRISLETILNSNAKEIVRKIHDATTPDNLKHHQYKSYDIPNETVQGIEKVKKFLGWISIDDELKKQLLNHNLELEIDETYPQYYAIPFQLSNSHTCYVYIGEKENPYWYGFKKSSIIEENRKEFQDFVTSLHLNKKNDEWFGWNEFKNPQKEDIQKIVEEITDWIKQIQDLKFE
ncbi:DUF262 domain-containing protein [Odoribacter sp. OttesenSCG-928-G04]|nr:DUF262 domain-containing protein [Odoribacter sp. OttesenSCG-928-G04]MDL2331023.1 DUF262 domain-containing protein [Odoribacter sp. OttesenSCG-928-A06]